MLHRSDRSFQLERAQGPLEDHDHLLESEATQDVLRRRQLRGRRPTRLPEPGGDLLQPAGRSHHHLGRPLQPALLPALGRNLIHEHDTKWQKVLRNVETSRKW